MAGCPKAEGLSLSSSSGFDPEDSLFVSFQVRAADAEKARPQAQHNTDMELPGRKIDLWLAWAGCSGQLLLTLSVTAPKGCTFFKTESPLCYT